MNKNTEKASEILRSGNYSLVLCKDEEILTFTDSGLKDLVSLCESGKDFYGFSCADKVVGRASAFLLVLLEVSEVYAPVMAKLSRNVLDRGEVKYFSDQIVDELITSDGKSDSFEEAVVRSGSAVIALQDIKRLLK